jgi:hypothetical protein
MTVLASHDRFAGSATILVSERQQVWRTVAGTPATGVKQSSHGRTPCADMTTVAHAGTYDRPTHGGAGACGVQQSTVMHHHTALMRA